MPGSAQLLATWEAGIAAGDPQRGLLLYALACPTASAEEMRAVPLGERDATLFGLRAGLFGSMMDVRLSCAYCTQEMEFELDTAEFAKVHELGDPVQVTVAEGPWTVTARPPNSGDLLAVRAELARGAGAAEARAVLLEACVLEARHGGDPCTPRELPVEVQHRLAAAVAESESSADVRLHAPCPECGQVTDAELDIVEYLWAELDHWARSTLLDVHLLATAYGWTEPEVLALSPVRRRYYLELAGHA